MTRVAAILGCTRQTAYTWVYQHGLADYAGIRMDRREELDKRDRMDAEAKKEKQLPVYATARPTTSLHLVETATAQDLMLQVSMKMPESLWQRVKIEAIRQRRTVSQHVQTLLEETHPQEQKPAATRRKKGEANE